MSTKHPKKLESYKAFDNYEKPLVKQDLLNFLEPYSSRDNYRVVWFYDGRNDGDTILVIITDPILQKQGQFLQYQITSGGFDTDPWVCEETWLTVALMQEMLSAMTLAIKEET